MDEAMSKLGLRRGQNWTVQDCINFLLKHQDIDHKKRCDRFYLTAWIFEQMQKVTKYFSQNGAIRYDDFGTVAESCGVHVENEEHKADYNDLAQEYIDDEGMIPLGEVGGIIRKMLDKQEQFARDRAHMKAEMSELEIEMFRDVFNGIDEEGRSVLLVSQVDRAVFTSLCGVEVGSRCQQTFDGSFSAVSKPIFAPNYSLE